MDQVYSQSAGLAMGLSLSPFLAEIFMGNLEEELSKLNIFPKVWDRYVDDVYAEMKKTHIRQFLRALNSFHPNIKFTMEEENGGRLPFLDVLAVRNENDEIEFDVYRKPTTTERYITADSQHPLEHKLAAFHSMIHRLVNLPLSDERFDTEKQYILRVAQVNGFSEGMIENLIRKKTNRVYQLQNTTHRRDYEPKLSRMVVATYHPATNDKLGKALNNMGFAMANKTVPNLAKLLGNPKDKLPKLR